MARPSPLFVGNVVAEVTNELQEEGILDEWGAAFGHHLADRIYKRRLAEDRAKARQKVAPKVEAAE